MQDYGGSKNISKMRILINGILDMPVIAGFLAGGCDVAHASFFFNHSKTYPNAI